MVYSKLRGAGESGKIRVFRGLIGAPMASQGIYGPVMPFKDGESGGYGAGSPGQASGLLSSLMRCPAGWSIRLATLKPARS